MSLVLKLDFRGVHCKRSEDPRMLSFCLQVENDLDVGMGDRGDRWPSKIIA